MPTHIHRPVQSNLSPQPAAVTASAWLLRYTAENYLALPLRVCQELVESPEALPVPGSRDYSLGIMLWREQWLPLVDLSGLISGTQAKPLDEQSHCLVVAYSTGKGVDYAVLSLPYLPYLVTVSDNDICALPTNNPIWESIASSCFAYNDKRVPIVDAGRLFDYRIDNHHPQ